MFGFSQCAWCRASLITILAGVGLLLVSSGGSGGAATTSALVAWIMKTLSVSAAVAGKIALGLITVVIIALGVSGAFDWVCCNWLHVEDCCPPSSTQRFWDAFSSIVEQGEVYDEDCENLTSIIDELERSGEVDSQTLQRLREVVTNLCE